MSRSCFPTGTLRTALALAARRPAGAGATPLTETDWAALPRCKQRLYRARKRAADLAEQARLEAENQARLADLAAKLWADMELREAAKLREAPGPTTAPDQPHHPAPPRYLPARPPVEREEVVITIRQPTTFPGTPIRRG